LGWVTYVSFRNPRQLTVARVLALIAICLCGASLAAMCEPWVASVNGGLNQDYFTHGFGGQTGSWIYTDFFAELLGTFGSAMVLGIFYLLSVIFVLTSDVGAEIERAIHFVQDWFANRKERRAQEKKL